jgi:hypothetical protein
VKLSETVILGRAWMNNAANVMVSRIKVKTKGGSGIDGRFPAYSDAYRERKMAGKVGRITKKGTGFRQSSRSGTPDLTLTGDFLRDLKRISVTETGFTIGWPAQGAKVGWAADQGRAVSTEDQPLAEDVEQEFRGAVDAEISRRLRASAGSVTLNLRL